MYGRDQLDYSPTNGLNHYLPLIKTGAHRSGERFRATMALLLFQAVSVLRDTISLALYESMERLNHYDR